MHTPSRDALRTSRSPPFHPSPFEEQFAAPRGRWISARDGAYLKPRNSWTDRNCAIAPARAA